ncbi:MAG TPA: aminoacyl-tRNA hydrolase [Candidatus Pacearchaeota archaeon]|nr:aminoacyl-tRNA hydrolase [Candidatus Pacearchaeota archaeon]
MEKKMMEKTPAVFIIGLGNPGDKYQNTPHNAGFLAVDEFARRFEFPKFAMMPDGILVARKEIFGKTVILAKPQMLMNNSGKALAKLFNYLKIRPKKFRPDLWVINDDLDIPLGKIKISQNRGAAGHKGVQSIIDQLKTKNFIRFRIGIASPIAQAKKIAADKYVLKKIPGADRTPFDQAIGTVISALSLALSDNPEKSMTEFNQ